MSLVVAVSNGYKTWLAADDIATSGDTRIYVSEPKMFWNKNFLIGVVGTIRAQNIIRYFAAPEFLPENFADENSAREFMVTKFMPKLKQAFDDADYQPGEDNQWSMLIAVGKYIIGIDWDFSVAFYDRYAAIGAGEQAALASIEALYEAYSDQDIPWVMTTEYMLHAVIRAVAKHSIYVSDNVVVDSTKVDRLPITYSAQTSI